MKEDITDRELLEITKRKREDIEVYRRQRGEPRPLRESLVAMARPGQRKKKDHRKNKRDLPEKEYILITNKFTEAMFRQYLRPNESKVLWFVIRKTWGWQKRSEFIPLKQFVNALDLIPPNIVRALSSLAQRQIVIKLDNKRYAIQSDTSLWQDKPRKSGAKKHKLPKK